MDIAQVQAKPTKVISEKIDTTKKTINLIILTPQYNMSL